VHATEALKQFEGEIICEASVVDDDLILDFGVKGRLRIWDDGQSCCESRYMVCDDDLSHFVGAMFMGAEVRDAPNEQHEYGEHEVQFLIIKTWLGDFTIATHNEHNGYYGGFSLSAVVD
jgi:hypothetical protein